MKSSAWAAWAAAFDLVERGVGTAVGDVVADRHREQEGLVEHDADVRAQAGHREVAHVVPVDEHAAAVDVVEAGEEAGHGRLARSRCGPPAPRSHPAPHVQVEMERRLGVSAPSGVAERARRGTRRRPVGADEVDGAGPVDDCRRARRGSRRCARPRPPPAGRSIDDHAEEAERRLQHHDVGVEGDEGADRELRRR